MISLINLNFVSAEAKYDEEIFNKLVKNSNIKKIHLQEVLHVALDESGPLVNANDV